MDRYLKMMWTEKHRPNAPEFVIGEAKNKILPLLKDEASMPHLLLHSSAAGTGKTTLSIAIANELGTERLFLNTSDDRKIDVIRERVKDFSRTRSLTGKRKVVIMDEIDGMLKASQEALRRIMEEYAGSVLFILTCNDIHKIHDAVRNRCVEINFSYPPKDEIKDYLKRICELESLQYNEEGLDEVINSNYPSIRGMVLALQILKSLNLPVIPGNIEKEKSVYDRIYDDYMVDKDYVSVKERIYQLNLDAKEFNNYLWHKFVTEKNLKGIQLCGNNERWMSVGADPKVILVSSLIELVK